MCILANTLNSKLIKLSKNKFGTFQRIRDWGLGFEDRHLGFPNRKTLRATRFTLR